MEATKVVMNLMTNCSNLEDPVEAKLNYSTTKTTTTLTVSARGKWGAIRQQRPMPAKCTIGYMMGRSTRHAGGKISSKEPRVKVAPQYPRTRIYFLIVIENIS